MPSHVTIDHQIVIGYQTSRTICLPDSVDFTSCEFGCEPSALLKKRCAASLSIRGPVLVRSSVSLIRFSVSLDCPSVHFEAARAARHERKRSFK